MKRLKFETNNELDLFCLGHLIELHEASINDVNEPQIFTLAEVAQEIAIFLDCYDIARIKENECPDGCVGCEPLQGEQKQ